MVISCRDYLLGFRKRKAARRKFGLDMQAMKDRKAHLAEKKQVQFQLCFAQLIFLSSKEKSLISSTKQQQSRG
jgi:hypothetical protein